MRKRHDEERQPSDGGEQELDQLKEEMDKAIAKADEYFKLLQRVQADFANYKRRVDQERSEFARSVKADVILKTLPVLDDFGRALELVPEEIASLDWARGISLIHRKLVLMLENEGLKQMEARGREFDPWEHEAILHQETSDMEEGRVLAVVREGYKLDDKVIRPAQVIVAKRPATAGDEAGTIN
ncbi:MAG: nucleotide exchange factor GrpE [Chloroflexi bacterium]|nr:nucleotide exchange factor GrpE [Chloroflexota bacterium]